MTPSSSRPISSAEVLLRLWAGQTHAPDAVLTDAVVQAIAADAAFDVDAPMGDGHLPLQAALSRKVHVPAGELARWPMAGEAPWDGTGAHADGERVAAALLARGANPFREIKSWGYRSDPETPWDLAARMRSESIAVSMLRHPEAERIPVRDTMPQAMETRQHRLLAALAARVRLKPNDPLLFEAETGEAVRILLEAGANPHLRDGAGKTLSQAWAQRLRTGAEREPLEAALADALGHDPEHLRARLRGAAVNDRLSETLALLKTASPEPHLWAFAAGGALIQAFGARAGKATLGVASHLASRPVEDMSDEERAFWPAFSRVLASLRWKNKDLPEATDNSRKKWREFGEKTGHVAAGEPVSPPGGWGPLLSRLDVAMAVPITGPGYRTYSPRLALWCLAERLGVRPGEFFDAIGLSYGRGRSIAYELDDNVLTRRLRLGHVEQMTPRTAEGALALLWMKDPWTTREAASPRARALMDALGPLEPLFEAALTTNPDFHRDALALREHCGADAPLAAAWLDARLLATQVHEPTVAAASGAKRRARL